MSFEKKAVWAMGILMEELSISVMDAAAIMGNFGHESGGLSKLQEINPTVQGSLGGYGWGQWTGMKAGGRRKAFMDWCEAQGLKPSSDEANIGFAIHELTKTPEKRALTALRRAVGLEDKVVAFEKAYERAGVKHYPSRLRWARKALNAWEAASPQERSPRPPAANVPTLETFTNDQVRAIQENLRRLGYFEVGKIDGLWGEKTIGAIGAFQASQGVPVNVGLTPTLDPATLQLLATASPRVVSEQRQNTTTDDLRQQGSSTVKYADRINWAQWAQIGMAVLEAVVIAWQTYKTTPLPFGSDMLLSMLGTPAWLLPIAQFAFAMYSRVKANDVIMARLRAERSGMHNGEPDPSPSPPTHYAPEPQQGLPNVNAAWPWKSGT